MNDKRVTIEWYGESQKVILINLYPKHTLDDLYTVGADALSMLNSTDNTVHAIWQWCNHATLVKGGFVQFTRYLIGAKPQNLGHTVFIGGLQNSYHQALLDLGIKTAIDGDQFKIDENLFYASSMEDALVILNQNTDTKIPL